jgi:hypothetical protein
MAKVQFNFQSDTAVALQNSSNGLGQFNNSGTVEKKAGSGSSAFNGGGNFNNQAGTISVQTGTLVLSSSGTNTGGGTFNASSGATLDLTGGYTPTYSGTYTGSGGGTILLQNGTLYVDASGATFNFPSPMFQWTGGTIRNNTFTNNGAITIAYPTGNNPPCLSGATLNNSGTINVSGTNPQQLQIACSYHVPATLNNLVGGVFDFQSDTYVAIDQVNNPGSQFNNSGLVEKTAGTGTSSINGELFPNSGTVSVQSGTLAFPGGLSSSGGLDVRSAGTLSSSSLSLAGSGVLTVAIGGLNPGTQYGQLNLSGSATLSGTLDLNLVNKFVPTPGNAFQILNYGSSSGAFAGTQETALPSGIALFGAYNPGNLTETANSVVTTQDNVTGGGIQYNGWRGVSDPNASGGAYRVSKVKNDSVTFKFSGTSITWVSLKGPDQGIAVVYLDGVKKATLDLYSPTVQYQVRETATGLSAGSHTLIIGVTGTKNSQSSDTNIVLDAFIVGGTTTQENANGVQYDTWKGASNKNASGGTVRFSPSQGAVASLTFSGTGVGWTTALGPAFGIADVVIDGIDTGNVDLYAATLQGQVVFAYSGLSAGTHTIQIEPTGTKNALSTGTTVVLDALLTP